MRNSKLTDEELMNQLVSGDILSFNELYSRYSSKVYSFTLSRVKSSDTANDILQNVWEKIYKKAHTFKTAEKFSTWIFKITYNSIIDEFRKSVRNKNLLETIYQENSINEDNLDHTLPEIPVEKLKTPYKEALTMRYIKGLSIKEVATNLNIKEPNARKILSRGLKQLKQIMEKV